MEQQNAYIRDLERSKTNEDYEKVKEYFELNGLNAIERQNVQLKGGSSD